MNALPFLALFLFLLAGCHSSSSHSAAKEDSLTQIVNQPPGTLAEAKDLSKKIFDYAEQSEARKITKEQYREMSTPLQERLDFITGSLDSTDKAELETYRAGLLNEMLYRKANLPN